MPTPSVSTMRFKRVLVVFVNPLLEILWIMINKEFCRDGVRTFKQFCSFVHSVTMAFLDKYIHDLVLQFIKLHILHFCYFFFLPSPWQTQKLPKVLRTIAVSARPTQYGIAMIKSFSKSMHCESKHCCTDYFGKNNHSAVKKNTRKIHNFIT